MDPKVFQLEYGWKLLASDLCFGKGLEVDFMGMDSNRAPVAILALSEEEQELCPLRMLDLLGWFRRNKDLIRQTWMRLCPELVSLDLRQELRFFLIANEYSQGFLERLSCLSSLDLRVFRLRSLGVRGRHYWYAEGVPPWTSGGGETSPMSAPSGVGDEGLRERIDAFLAKVQVVGESLVGRALDFEGGRFDRRVLAGNELVLELGVVQEEAWVRIPGYSEDFHLGGPEEQARVLDGFLRSLMARCAPSSKASNPSPGPHLDGEIPSEPGRGVSHEGSPTDSGLRGPHRLDRSGGPRLSDEEMAAFFGS